jgi:hypothetical protein
VLPHRLQASESGSKVLGRQLSRYYPHEWVSSCGSYNELLDSSTSGSAPGTYYSWSFNKK